MVAYMGVDISKGYADFTLLDDQKVELEKVFQLDDTRQGHEKLKLFLGQKIKLLDLEMVYCAVESTGGFENNWYAFLMDLSKSMPVRVARLNPSGVKSNAQATLSRNITDALSSRYIAEYLIAQSHKVSYDQPSEFYSSFRSLHKHIILLRKQKTQLINQIKMVLYSGFPEMIRYCKEGIPDWVLLTLIKYPSARAIAKSKKSQLLKIKHMTTEKAQNLIEKAKNSVASRANNMQEYLIKTLATQILEQQKLLEEHKKFLSKQCQGSETALLQSIPGVGAYSASAIMIEIEDIRRFSSPDKLCCYFGLHPVYKQSGDKQGAYRLSKKGRPAIRAALYMCAQTAVMHDANLKSIYHRHRSKKKNHRQAIGAIMHKMLRIIWGVLYHQTQYQSSIDQRNQQKRLEPADQNDQKSKEVKSKRRYQDLDKEAPVSRMQTKKRKAYAESQVEHVKQVRDQQHTPV